MCREKAMYKADIVNCAIEITWMFDGLIDNDNEMMSWDDILDKYGSSDNIREKLIIPIAQEFLRQHKAGWDTKNAWLVDMQDYAKEQLSFALRKSSSGHEVVLDNSNENHIELLVTGTFRTVKISAGMTEEYELIRTDAPNELIENQIRINIRKDESDNTGPYDYLLKKGYFVYILGCQYDFDDKEVKFDIEFDSYAF